MTHNPIFRAPRGSRQTHPSERNRALSALFGAFLLCGLLSTTAVAQNYNGYVDGANCGVIGGWAWDATQPNTSINVDIFDGTTLIATVPANNFRQDLYNAGYGNGNHGYTIATPASLKNNQYHYIYVKYSGTNLLLNNSDAPVFCTATATGYQYYYSDTFPSINSAAWSQTGGLSIGAGGLTNPSTNGTGSLISKAAVPGGNTHYEVKATLALKHTSGSGGNYDMYLEATADALYPAYGTFYVVTVQDPMPTGNGSYSATLSLYKRVNGLIGFLTSTSLTVHDASVLRAVHTGSGQIIVYSDNSIALYAVDTTISSGQPGVGLRNVPLVNGASVNGISRADLGPLDTVAPTAINAQQISTSPFPTRVDIHSPGTVDDPNGTGIAFYQLWRNGAFLLSYTTMNFTDLSVSAGNTYSYILIAFDYHLNNTQTGFTVVTPPAGAIDPREVGVRPTGSYWGGAGEKIDMRSGNLNYTIPLIKAMARSGWSASFNLSYNSQNWRQDPANTWHLGQEVGYGWRLQAGSLMPVYKDYYTLDHYIFMDATGAEYRLDQNNGAGVWTSKESIYVSFDSNADRLYFTDGSFWTFGSTSAATEQDAGVMYPTLMEDSNGNQVVINYNAGGGLASANSSSRIQTIQDLRGNYTFTYNYLNAVPRLVNITNNIGTAEKYNLNFGNSSALVSPWNAQTNFGTINLLGGITATGPNLTTNFAYDVSGAPYFDPNAGTGELIRVTTPYGGHLRWDYVANTLAGLRAFREVQTRSILLSSTGTETGVSIYRDSGDNNRSVHLYANFFDWSGLSNKVWWFETNTALFDAALPTAYEERNYPSGTALFHQDFTWAQTPTTANPYISSTLTTLDPSQTYQAQKKTTQTLDQYGNLTQMFVYNFGLSTLARTYTNTYLTSSSYTSRYIFNRLQLSTVTDGTNTTTLSHVYYDGEPGSCGGFSFNDPGTQSAPVGMHDTSYGTSFFTRGMPGTVVTPASTVCTNYDIGGNVTSSSTNGVTTTSTTASGSDYAVPTVMTTGSLSNNMGYTSFLAASSATGPNGESASIGYDSNARPLSTDSPSGAHTAITYNDTLSPPTIVAVTSSSSTNPHWSRKTMDGFGRTIKSETGSGSTPGTALSVVDTIYAPCGCSPLGKLWKTTMPYAPTTTPSWTIYTYDGSGRTIGVEAPDGNGMSIRGSTTTYAYQGNTVKVTEPARTIDPPGRWKQFTMDAMGNLTSVLETDPALGQVTTAYTYDMLSHLTHVRMTRGSTTQDRYFNYTSGATVGAHLLSATNPENGLVSYTYNPDHTLNTKTDAKGQLFTYTYDGYKRLLSVTVGTSLLRTYSYDTNPFDANYSQFSAGRLTAIQYAPINYEVYFGSPQGSTTFTDMFTYAQPGQVAGKRLRVTKAQPYLNGQNHTQTAVGDLNLGYIYNKEGKLATATYPTDAYAHTPSFNYSFDPMMRPAGMTDQNSASVVSGVQYGPSNELTQMTYNGGTEYHSYNSLLQLTNISSLGQNITYTFPLAGSNVGKIASQTDSISGEIVTYLYDSLNRLTSASASAWGQTYTYDGFGNLTGRAGTGTAQSTTINTPADAATNRLSGYTYDLNGNQISTGYAYDAENRLVQANAGAVQYGYDGQNKRIWQATFSNCGGDSCMSSDSISLFGVDGKQIGTYTAGAAWNNTQTQLQLSFYSTTQRVYFGKKLVATLDWQGNQQGVVQDRLSSVGKYYPFGEERNSPPMANDQVKFATYTRDSATGLDYANQRYYANMFGRFMSADPYQASGGPSMPQSWNRYTYVTGDPVNKFDPSGLRECYMTDENTGDEVDCSKDVMPTDRSPSPAQQAKVKAWLPEGTEYLQDFDTNSEKCVVDLALIGLSVDAVRKWANDVLLENADAANPAIAAKMIEIGADFTPDPNNTNGLLFESQNFWQKNFKDVLGTLVHEFAHLEHPGKTDADFQTALQVKVDQSDTADISRKVRDDCFKSVQNPQ